MAGRRVLTYGGLTAAAAAGYYLYQAGGDPKVAEKKFESDAAKLSSKAKSAGKDAEANARYTGQEAGKKIDNLANQAKAQADKFDQKVEAYGQSAQKNFEEARVKTGDAINRSADVFDKKVSEGISKTKSSTSSWFGGSK